MAANRANIAWYLDNMIAAPAAEATVHTIFRTEDGVMLCYGTPGDTDLEAPASPGNANVYAPGCIYIRALTGGGSICYFNDGTKAAPNFVPISF